MYTGRGARASGHVSEVDFYEAICRVLTAATEPDLRSGSHTLKPFQRSRRPLHLPIATPPMCPK